jgi:hypothetical protein
MGNPTKNLPVLPTITDLLQLLKHGIIIFVFVALAYWIEQLMRGGGGFAEESIPIPIPGKAYVADKEFW